MLTFSILYNQAPPEIVPDGSLGGGEAALFWILAPVTIIGALGLLFAKKAVHAAISLALVMLCLALFYAAQDAQFLFAAQIVVYTGAVMMLFLFVLMLIGVDSAESLKETIRGQRVASVLGALGLSSLLIGAMWSLAFSETPSPPRGLESANAIGNPSAIARLLFEEHVIPFELVGTLLISAALGAIMLTHRERLAPPVTQKSLQARRVRDNYAVAGLPGPGVFARHNSVETPALLPDGSPSEASVSRVLRTRGQVLPIDKIEGDVDVIHGDFAAGIPNSIASSDDGEPVTKRDVVEAARESDAHGDTTGEKTS